MVLSKHHQQGGREMHELREGLVKGKE